MKSNDRFFLLDASSYLFRAYYAVSFLSNSKGIPTNATYGFTQMLLRLINEERPTHFVAFFDRSEPTFRKEEFAHYKAHRKVMPEDLAVQIPWIKKILHAMKIPVLEKAGFEADDLIGTIAKNLEHRGCGVVVVTGDKDLMQLVGEQICLLDTMKNRWIRREEVIERFGVGPEKVVEVLGLSGDASDNIPGVPGIGEKTASALIQQFGSIENLYENLDQLKGKRKEILAANRDQAFLSRKLVTIKTDVPIEYALEDFDLSPPDLPELTSLFQELEFSKLLQQFQTPAVSDTDSHSENRYQLVNDLPSFRSLLEKLQSVPFLALDTETDSLNSLEANLVGISLALEENEAFYIPIAHSNSPEIAQLSLQEVVEGLKPILEDPLVPKVAQNFKYDGQVLERVGIQVEGLICDTMIADYLIDPTQAHNLNKLAERYLNYKMITYEEVVEGKKYSSFAQVPILRAMEYSAEDAQVTWKLSRILMEELKKRDLFSLFQEIEIPLVCVLSEMEKAGIKVDRPYLLELQEDFARRIQQSEERIYELAGDKFNINSTKQLGALLFEKLKLPVQRKTKTGFSTDVDVLTELAKHHELPKEILCYRSLAKLKSTYIDALLALTDHRDRVHTSFNQTVAETGRLSSSEPNLQNIPIRTEDGRKIRRAFIADERFVILSADYSQIELRILAHFSQDPALLDAFEKEKDVHRITASSIFKRSPESLTSEMRAVGKTVNFAVIYGQSAYGLSRQLEIPPKIAQVYIDQYFSIYRKVREYREKVLREAEEKGKVFTLYGRQRPVPDLQSRNAMIRANGERVAFNSVIQGTAADLIKIAMVKIDNKIKELKIKSRLLLQVHDELVFEVLEHELPALKSLVKKEMESVAQFSIPIRVDLGVGQNWGEAH